MQELFIITYTSDSYQIIITDLSVHLTTIGQFLETTLDTIGNVLLPTTSGITIPKAKDIGISVRDFESLFPVVKNPGKSLVDFINQPGEYARKPLISPIHFCSCELSHCIKNLGLQFCHYCNNFLGAGLPSVTEIVNLVPRIYWTVAEPPVLTFAVDLGEETSNLITNLTSHLSNIQRLLLRINLYEDGQFDITHWEVYVEANNLDLLRGYIREARDEILSLINLDRELNVSTNGPYDRAGVQRLHLLESVLLAYDPTYIPMQGYASVGIEVPDSDVIRITPSSAEGAPSPESIIDREECDLYGLRPVPEESIPRGPEPVTDQSASEEIIPRGPEPVADRPAPEEIIPWGPERVAEIEDWLDRVEDAISTRETYNQSQNNSGQNPFLKD